jgi:hypothetical protein
MDFCGRAKKGRKSSKRAIVGRCEIGQAISHLLILNTKQKDLRQMLKQEHDSSRNPTETTTKW